MNFNELQKNVAEMQQKIEEANINPEDMKIEYTKFDGYNCLWAMYGDEVIAYFKW